MEKEVKKKVCNKCAEEKPLDEFHKNKRFKDGLKNTCKKCTNDFKRKWCKNNPEKKKEQDKKWRKNNLDKINNLKKQWRKRNQEKEKQYTKKYRNKNSKECILRTKIWQKNNLEKILEIKKNFKENNPNYYKEYLKEYREKNPYISIWRNVLKSVLGRFNKKKEGHTIDLLGYSALQLKQRIECQFTDGMSWDNYGEWHIDHIKGVVKFDKDTPPHVVNMLCNLRPLWATSRIINKIFYEGNLNKPKY